MESGLSGFDYTRAAQECMTCIAIYGWGITWGTRGVIRIGEFLFSLTKAETSFSSCLIEIFSTSHKTVNLKKPFKAV